MEFVIEVCWFCTVWTVTKDSKFKAQYTVTVLDCIHPLTHGDTKYYWKCHFTLKVILLQDMTKDSQRQSQVSLIQAGTKCYLKGLV